MRMAETPLLTIDFKNFVLGESASARNANRGFSPQSYGINLLKEKGTLYFQETETDRGTGIQVSDAIAACPDPDYLGNDLYIVDAGGNFYTLNGATYTKRQTDSAKTYTRGTTDIIKFNGEVFATSNDDVAKLTGSTLGTIDNDWWSVTRGHGALQTSFRHPLEVVEDTLYIGDKNYLHTWDGTNSVSQAMTLPYYVNITSLRKHPDGKHLIAFCGVTANYSHTRNGGGLIYVIDTTNLEWIREIPTESQVEGSKLIGGVVYTTYGAKLGYFNGDGIEWLRDLTSGSNTYSHEMDSAEGVLLIRDGSDLLAYGDAGGEGKVWWRAYRTSATGYATFTMVRYKGNGVVTLGYNISGAKLGEINLNNAGLLGAFYSNHELAGQNIAIRRIEIDHTETPSSGVNAFFVQLFDRVGNVLHSETKSYTNTPTSHSRIDLDAFVDDIQLCLSPSNGAMGFRQIRVYGESIE